MDGPVTTVRGHTWVKLTGPRGLTFMAKGKRGQHGRCRGGDRLRQAAVHR